MDMTLAGPSLGQSMDIYGCVAKATTASCGHDRVFGERAYIRRAAHRLDKEEPAA
jgi:hypothetical protein